MRRKVTFTFAPVIPKVRRRNELSGASRSSFGAGRQLRRQRSDRPRRDPGPGLHHGKCAGLRVRRRNLLERLLRLRCVRIDPLERRLSALRPRLRWRLKLWQWHDHGRALEALRGLVQWI